MFRILRSRGGIQKPHRENPKRLSLRLLLNYFRLFLFLRGGRGFRTFSRSIGRNHRLVFLRFGTPPAESSSMNFSTS